MELYKALSDCALCLILSAMRFSVCVCVSDRYEDPIQTPNELIYATEGYVPIYVE